MSQSFALVLLFCFSLPAFSCDDNHAKIMPSGLLGEELMICRSGQYRTLQINQIEKLLSTVGKNADSERWVKSLSEGQLDYNGLTQALGKSIGIDESPINNIDSSGRGNSEQLGVMNEMAKAWNDNMTITKEKKFDIFSPEVFNQLGQKNDKFFESLSAPAKQCGQTPDDMKGVQIKFTDGYATNLMPLQMTKIGNNRYKIRFREKKNLMEAMGPVQEREIEIDKRRNQIVWNHEGEKYYINRQSLPVYNADYFFANDVCEVERDVEHWNSQDNNGSGSQSSQ